MKRKKKKANMTFKWTSFEGETIEELDKKQELASARYLYALQQRRYWNNEIHLRGQTFEAARIAYFSKKRGLLPDELAKSERQQVASIWTWKAGK